MKKLMLCALLSLVACKAKPTFQDVKMGNGSPGFLMSCPIDMGQDECLTYAKDRCGKAPYDLVATNVGNNKGVLLVTCK
jgi:hypothetical protein